ncbi:MAG: DNA-binding response OmpR family regulator [Flammeovirgaceae bacterium]|jgi:DNA-binding response OmpR family regulator
MAIPTKILVVEDDEFLGMMIQELLETRKFNTQLSKNGNQGYEDFVTFQPDLCIFDVNMPEKDGFTLAKEVRAIDKNVPIVFLTAKSMKADVLEGFAIGADDYVKKPFSMEELIMRINAILRRTLDAEPQNEQEVLEIGAYKFSPKLRLLKFGEKELVLTQRESDLLFLLSKQRNQLLEREYTLKKLWGDNSYFQARSMDVHITNLRKKLKLDSSIQIVNVRGRGYKLLEIEEGLF